MNLYKRGKVFYMDFIYLGTRINRSTGKTTEKEALEVVKATKEKLLDDLSSPKPQAFMMLSEAIERTYGSRWVDTEDGEKSRRRAYLAMNEIGGDRPINEIDWDMVDKMGASLISRGRERATANRYKSALRTVLRHVGKSLPKYCIPKIDTPQEHFKRFRVYTKAEEKAICEWFKANGKPLMADLVVVLLDTGMRLSEALAQPLVRTESHIHVLKAKNKKARSIPMTKRVRDILKGVEAFPYNRDSAEYLWNQMRAALGHANEPDFILHTCRHTCASRLIQAGEPLEVVKEFMGHSSMTITLRYAHHKPDRLLGAAAALDKFNEEAVVTLF